MAFGYNTFECLYFSIEVNLYSVFLVMIFLFKKLTIYPMIQAAISEPSLTPSMLCVNSKEMITANVTKVMSKPTFIFPNSLL